MPTNGSRGPLPVRQSRSIGLRRGKWIDPLRPGFDTDQTYPVGDAQYFDLLFGSTFGRDLAHTATSRSTA